MKRNPTLLPDLCWVTLSLHPTYKTTKLQNYGSQGRRGLDVYFSDA
ncbi:hypothetical protein [Nostoc sp. DSM 114159]